MAVFALHNETRWTCPNCDVTDITHEPGIHTRFHSCRGLRGLTAPMVEDGVKCKIEALDREDYVKQESVQTDGDGRPVMSVKTTRDNGEDCAVFAPVAMMGVR
jgi:hypothetical protein